MLEVPTIERMNTLLLELMVGINAMAFRILGNKIISGPFAGMEIPEQSMWNDGNASTKLVGSYEYELHGAIAKIIERSPRTIVDIGCAEGFYAIGLARALPQVRVEAIDVNDSLLAQCAEYALKNGVAERISLRKINPTEQEFGSADLFIIDNEGNELDLLRGSSQRYLRSDIIVECHDFMHANTSAILAEEFQKTHDVDIIEPRLPPLGNYDFLAASPTVMTILVVAEKRPMPTRWLACWAKERGY